MNPPVDVATAGEGSPARTALAVGDPLCKAAVFDGALLLYK